MQVFWETEGKNGLLSSPPDIKMDYLIFLITSREPFLVPLCLQYFFIYFVSLLSLSVGLGIYILGMIPKAPFVAQRYNLYKLPQKTSFRLCLPISYLLTAIT